MKRQEILENRMKAIGVGGREREREKNADFLWYGSSDIYFPHAKETISQTRHEFLGNNAQRNREREREREKWPDTSSIIHNVCRFSAKRSDISPEMMEPNPMIIHLPI